MSLHIEVWSKNGAEKQEYRATILKCCNQMAFGYFWPLKTFFFLLPSISEPHFGNNYISCRCCWSTSTECPKMTRKFPSQQLAIELPTWGTAVVDWKRGCPSICILCSIYIYSGPPSLCAAVFAMFAQFIFIAGEAPYSKPPSSCAAHCCAGHCCCWNARRPHQTQSFFGFSMAEILSLLSTVWILYQFEIISHWKEAFKVFWWVCVQWIAHTVL